MDYEIFATFSSQIYQTITEINSGSILTTTNFMVNFKLKMTFYFVAPN